MTNTTLRAPTTAAALGRGRVITGRRMQGPRPATAERAMLAAAIAQVAEHGVRTLTPVSAGAAVGYGRGIVSDRFGDRAALLDALTKDLQDRFEPPVSDRPGLERLLEAVDAYLRQRTPHAHVFVTLWAEALAGEPDLQSGFAARDARFRATLIGYLRDGIADGSIRADIDPEALAFTLVGQLRMAVLQLPSDAGRTEHVALIERGLRAG